MDLRSQQEDHSHVVLAEKLMANPKFADFEQRLMDFLTSHTMATVGELKNTAFEVYKPEEITTGFLMQMMTEPRKLQMAGFVKELRAGCKTALLATYKDKPFAEDDKTQQDPIITKAMNHIFNKHAIPQAYEVTALLMQVEKECGVRFPASKEHPERIDRIR